MGPCPAGRTADTWSVCGFFVPAPAGAGGCRGYGFRNRKKLHSKGGMPIRRELLNQGLMYGLVSLFVFIAAPFLT